MKSDYDTCVSRWPFVNHRTFLVLWGVGVTLALPFALPCNASAQLQLEADAGVVCSAQSAVEDPLGHPASQLDLAEGGLGDEPADGVDPPVNSSVNANAVEKVVERNEVLGQINAIRRQMRGGVAAQLEGLFDDPEHGREQLQREFEQQLSKLVATPRPNPVSASVVQPGPSGGAMPRVCASLRNAARELDSVAADLEDVELYGEADRVRASARSLRLQARAMVVGRTANAVQASPRLPSLGRSEAPAKILGLPANALGPRIRPRQ